MFDSDELLKRLTAKHIYFENLYYEDLDKISNIKQYHGEKLNE